jgi:hypothetical protein
VAMRSRGAMAASSTMTAATPRWIHLLRCLKVAPSRPVLQLHRARCDHLVASGFILTHRRANVSVTIHQRIFFCASDSLKMHWSEKIASLRCQVLSPRNIRRSSSTRQDGLSFVGKCGPPSTDDATHIQRASRQAHRDAGAGFDRTTCGISSAIRSAASATCWLPPRPPGKLPRPDPHAASQFIQLHSSSSTAGAEEIGVTAITVIFDVHCGQCRAPLPDEVLQAIPSIRLEARHSS